MVARAGRGEAKANASRPPTSKAASGNWRSLVFQKKIPSKLQEEFGKKLESRHYPTFVVGYAPLGNVSLRKGFSLSRLRSENNSTHPAGQRLVSSEDAERIRKDSGVVRISAVAIHEQVDLLSLPPKPEWRNWYTHQTQNLARSNSCRFESDLRHQLLTSRFKAQESSSLLVLRVIFQGTT